jgi:non-homologous end joining protein Ku
MLDLASHIVKTKAGRFDPEKFEDQYEDALKELLKRKQEGEPIERPERPKQTNVINLMDTLRRSIRANKLVTVYSDCNSDCVSLHGSSPSPLVGMETWREATC